MKKYRVGIVSLLAILIASCARAPDETLNLTVGSSDPAIIEEVRRILWFRFDEFRLSFFSSVESRVDGSRLTFRFKGGAPEQAVVSYLYETPGRVKASLVEGSAVLFTDRDIKRAALAYENEGHVVRLGLTRTAGDRVLALTRRNVGKTARLTLDGRVLLEARITSVLRDYFQVTSPEQDAQRARALVVVLNSGALPAKVTRSL